MNDLFKNIDDIHKTVILQGLESNILNYKKNMLIMSNLQNLKFLAIVIEGEININKIDYNCEKYLIKKIEKNQLFSSVDVPINNECEIETIKDTKILLIDFDNILNSNIDDEYYPIFLKNVISLQNKYLDEKNNKIQIISNKTIRNKLLQYFKQQSIEYNSKSFELQITFTQLANYIAADRSAMNRELKHLKDENLIKINGKRIKLLYY